MVREGIGMDMPDMPPPAIALTRDGRRRKKT